MPEQAKVVITRKTLKQQLSKMPKWKSSGSDGVHGHWSKSFTTLHDTIVQQLGEILTSREVPSWMVNGKTTLIVKDKTKGNLVSNFRPITCLPMMWKLFTGIIAEEIYSHLESNNILPVEQKGCRKKSRGNKDQLLIDKMILKNSKKRMTNLCLAWIDYKKTFDMVPHSWLLECLLLYNIIKNVIEVLSKSMKHWKTSLTAGGMTLGEINIKKGIFQGYSLSPILFVLALIPLSKLLNDMKDGYHLGKNRPKVNHLLYMDDLKLYAKDKKELDTLIQTVRVFSKDIGMDFGIEKCAMIQMKRGKFVMSEGIELPNGKKIRSLDDQEGYKYLGILQFDDIKHKEVKEKLKKEYVRRVRKILKSHLNGGNVIQAINASHDWSVKILH